MKFILYLALVNLVSCSLTNMESAEKSFNESQRNKLCAFMDIDTMFPDSSVRSLATASEEGDIETIKELIKSGIDPNSKGTRNCTVLFCSMRNFSGYKKMLELGADPNIIFDDGGSVIHWAVRHKDSEFLLEALKHGGNPNLAAGQLQDTPLIKAASPGNKDKVAILVNAGANLDSANTFGSTAMMTAAGLGQFDIVMELLIAGANYNLKNKSGKTLADIIKFRNKTMDPNNQLTSWMYKVIKWLGENGVAIDIETPQVNNPNKENQH